MSGDLPPSSSDSRFTLPAEAATIRRAVSTEPVKARRSTPGCSASACPASAPNPVTTLMTPSGTPASCSSSATRSALSEASSAGFRTAVEPVASVGPRIHHWLIRGAFHGMMPPTTPTGALSFMVWMLPAIEFCSVSAPPAVVCAA